jgi:KipI family sensor histidine kinase inhibitor
VSGLEQPPPGALRVVPFGDAALLVVLGEVIDERLNRRVHGLTAELAARLRPEAGWERLVPAYASLLVPFDPWRLGSDEAHSTLTAALAEVGSAAGWGAGATRPERADRLGPPGPRKPESPALEIPVRYGGADGPDLDEVATRCGLRPADVVELHAGSTYRVFLLGFSPGFAYLGPLPAALVLPRRDEPRRRVPEGSVAIAAEQTCVYPQATPGGWHLIGRTDLPLWDVRADPPARLRPGDRVRFVPLR